MLASIATAFEVRAAMLTEQFQLALNIRILVDQAKGVLAERGGVDMGGAFEALRRFARQVGQAERGGPATGQRVNSIRPWGGHRRDGAHRVRLRSSD